MPDRQAPVYSKIVSEVSEERFEPVGIGGYCGVVNIFEHAGQGASDVGVGSPDAEILEEFQIADDLVLILFRGKAVMDRGSAVRIPIDDQTATLPEPDPVGEQMNGPAVRDHARRKLLETFHKPPAQLALAVSGCRGDVLYRLLSEHPFVEPCGPVR